MGKIPHRGKWFWEDFDPAKSSGSDLADLRAGLNRDAGAVPAMWRHYRSFVPDSVDVSWRAPDGMVAEHAALSLFGVHQQGQRTLVHVGGKPIGRVLRSLRSMPDVSEDGVDRRFTAAATAQSAKELAGHLRGLITQLRARNLGFDYTALVEDLHDWRWPDSRSRARRRWGIDYYARAEGAAPTADADTTPGASTSTTTDGATA